MNAILKNPSKYLATYLAPRVRGNVIVPGGIIPSKGVEALNRTFLKNYSDMTPMGRLMDKKELIGAILYLSSDVSSYSTGSVLTVDDGWNAW